MIESVLEECYIVGEFTAIIEMEARASRTGPTKNLKTIQFSMNTKEKVQMVYCTKCGTNNPDDAQVCKNCGAPLYTTGESRHYRHMEDECFGIPRGGTIVGLAIGVIILLAGVIWFLQQANILASNVSVWPFAVIIFGILLVIGALYGMRRRH